MTKVCCDVLPHGLRADPGWLVRGHSNDAGASCEAYSPLH